MVHQRAQTQSRNPDRRSPHKYCHYRRFYRWGSKRNHIRMCSRQAQGYTYRRTRTWISLHWQYLCIGWDSSTGPKMGPLVCLHTSLRYLVILPYRTQRNHRRCMSLRCHRCSKCHHHHRVARSRPDTRTCRHCRFSVAAATVLAGRRADRHGVAREWVNAGRRPRLARAGIADFSLAAATVRAGQAVGDAREWVFAGLAAVVVDAADVSRQALFR